MVMAESEKITINMSVVDLGQVDLLVEEGFYTNRTDFIRTAIRNQLNTHGEVLKQTLTRKSFAVGIIFYTRKELENYQKTGTMLDLRVVGMIAIANDITPELARATIHSVEIHGVFRASDAVKSALADRIKA